MEQGLPVEQEAEVGGTNHRRASRTARDLLPVTAAAGATALLVTVVVGGSTSRLDTASLADAPNAVIDAPEAPVAGAGRDVTVRVTPRAGRPSAPALPADAGTLFDLAVAPAQIQPAQAVVLESAPRGLPRLTFPFTPSATATAPAIGAPAPADVTEPVAAPEPLAAPTSPTAPDADEPRAPAPRGQAQKPAKSTKTTSKQDAPTRTTSSTQTTTLSLQWFSLTSTEPSSADGEGKRKAKGRVDDPPPDHARADEKASAKARHS